jgi:Ca2+-binding RTX toxin-like protein
MPPFVRVVLLATVVTALLAPATATAGTLSVEDVDIVSSGELRVSYYASERADGVSVSRDGDRLVVDDTRGVDASSPCERVTPTRGTCPLESVVFIYVFLDAGSDSVEFAKSVTGADVVVEGYAGNDVIRGTRQGDGLYGGSGRDRIFALGGDDKVDGDGWYVEEDTPDNTTRDEIDGGRGYDHVTYGSGDESYFSPTVIHLGGGRGQDALKGVEAAFGGLRADTITGNSADNTLDGDEGKDTIRGKRGDDIIFADGARRISCGAGADEVALDPRTRPKYDCEHAIAGGEVPVRVATAYKVASGRIRFKVACPTEAEQRIEYDNAENEPCNAALRLARAAGGIAGQTDFNLERGESTTVAIPLRASDRRALANGKRFFVTAPKKGSYNEWGFAIPLDR